MPAEGVPPLDPKRIKAFGDKTRIRILHVLEHRPVSADELAADLGIPKNRIDHHIEVLLECDCIEVAVTRKREGRDTPFYTAIPSAVFPSSPLTLGKARVPITRMACQAFTRKAKSAFEAGVVDGHAEATFALETLALTAPHKATAHEAMRLTLANLRFLHEQSRQLNIATDTPVFPLEIGIALFEAPPPAADQGIE